MFICVLSYRGFNQDIKNQFGIHEEGAKGFKDFCKKLTAKKFLELKDDQKVISLYQTLLMNREKVYTKEWKRCGIKREVVVEYIKGDFNPKDDYILLTAMYIKDKA